MICGGAKAFDFEDSAAGDARRRPDLLVGKDQLADRSQTGNTGGPATTRGSGIVAARRLKSLKLM